MTRIGPEAMTLKIRLDLGGSPAELPGADGVLLGSLEAGAGSGGDEMSGGRGQQAAAVGGAPGSRRVGRIGTLLPRFGDHCTNHVAGLGVWQNAKHEVREK